MILLSFRGVAYHTWFIRTVLCLSAYCGHPTFSPDVANAVQTSINHEPTPGLRRFSRSQIQNPQAQNPRCQTLFPNNKATHHTLRKILLTLRPSLDNHQERHAPFLWPNQTQTRRAGPLSDRSLSRSYQSLFQASIT